MNKASQRCKADHDELLAHTYTVYKRSYAYGNQPHTHDHYEIFMMLENNVNYFADGVIYPLAPKELVAVHGALPHGKLTLNNPDAKFLVIILSKNFFIENNCTQYEDFFYPNTRTSRKISASVCEKSGLFDVYKRLEKYTDNFKNIDNAVTKSLLIEFLHILNTDTRFSQTYISSPQIEKALSYIDKHLNEKLTLDKIAEQAFLSKYHLCRLFKTYVGYTVNHYITLKRIEKTQALMNEKKNITEACTEAGFSDYSAFYKAFKKAYGTSPKSILKQN